MAEVYLVPGVFGAGGQILDQNGRPASGALITTYQAGTTTPASVYTTAQGNVTAANPVVCGADGRLPYELWQPVGQTIKIVLTDSVSSTLGTYDNLKGINDPLQVSGVALLSANNVFLGQINTFTNITANAIQVTSVSAVNTNVLNTLIVSTLSVVSITAGNVPLARLNASTVSSGYPQSGTGGETLRTIRGNVNGAGTITNGTGFSVIRNSAGNYTVVFTTAFSSAPTMAMGANSSVGNVIAVYNGFPGTVTTAILTFVGSTASDVSFSFIATGPA